MMIIRLFLTRGYPVHRMMFSRLLALMVLLTPGCSLASEPFDLRILWTNDTHGYLSPLYHREEGDARFVDRALREGRVGGFAYIASIINRQRAEMPVRTLLVDSGDTWHGTVIPVRLAGSPVVEVMNAMGYDAMTPGNVEFFYDKATLVKLFAAARFPIVAANIYEKEWNERVDLPNLQPYVIKQVGELKIAIVGMTYHWMSKVSNHPQWSFGLRTEEVQADINKLRTQNKVDLVILLSHMGWKADARYAELVSGIDVIVGAHTHDTLYRPTLVYNKKGDRDVLVVQSGSHGKMLGQLDLRISDRRVTAFEQTLFPIRIKELKPDPKITALIARFRAPYKEELERVVGETKTLLYRQGTWQSTADNLVSDALRARTNRDVAITQPGRYGATILPGPITVEDVYNLVPMESPIYQMKFSGSTLRRMLEGAVEAVVAEDPLRAIGANMWRYSGIELSLNLSKPYPDRIERIHIDGAPIKSEQLYSLAEFNMFFKFHPDAIEVVKTEQIGPHEVLAYIEEQKIVSPVLDKRITDQHEHIMSEHDHLHETWDETGQNKVDVENANVYVYHGKLDKAGRFLVN